MDNKTKAAHFVMEFLPIVGQDPYTGIKTAKECAIAAVKIAQQEVEALKCNQVLGQASSYSQIIKDIESF